MPTPLLYSPAISVVIPMYNTEKYVGACLTSILTQTFQNFEVIVVDDVSTDNSCAVVESFIPKFGGRLKLVRSEVNRGPAIPSNKGINLSCGKYVYQMDSDDLIVTNALEVLYNYAENFNADVVHMNVGFKFIRNSEKSFPNREDLDIVGWHGGPFVDKPTLESNDIAERAKKISKNGVGWTAWEKLVKRDLLMENDIAFANIRTCQDLLWVIEVFSLAKKILSIPEPLYVHRANPTSNTARKRTTEQALHFDLSATNVGLKISDEFLSSKKFFQENPQYKWELMRFFESVSFNNTRTIFQENPPHKIYEILKPKFSELFGENGALISYLVDSSHFMRWNMVQMSQRIAYLENQLKELQSK
ncbi:MAG: glycosyltransferase family 2 protein [Selenomonadaceae bacterium]|nr:glycosyltransferase family 2 protein [Selenomonadaceae bacterium]